MSLWILIVGVSVGALGKVLLGVTVIKVHGKIVAEHKLDRRVFSEMRTEKMIGLWSIAFIIIGFLLEISFYLNGVIF